MQFDKPNPAYDFFVERCGVDADDINSARIRSWRIVNGQYDNTRADVAKLGKLFWKGAEIDSPTWNLFVETYGLHVVLACIYIYNHGPGEASGHDYLIRALEDAEQEKINSDGKKRRLEVERILGIVETAKKGTRDE